MKFHITLLFALASAAFAQKPEIIRIDPALDSLIEPGATVETIASGFRWTEGPLWNPATGELLFSDIPNDVINAWSEKGLRSFMKPAGESNGITLDSNGDILYAEQAERRLVRLKGGERKITIADRFEGKRFNSPNDLVVHSSGAIYFTNPIYGLPKGEADPARELDYCGVFRVTADGKVTLINKQIERPNGIALSPDEKILYVANSHDPKPVIYAIPLAADGAAGEASVFFNTNTLGEEGSPDGLKVDSNGNIWTTGPGGVLVISKEGKLLGRILTHQHTGNLTFGGKDGKTVFITANDRLMRLTRR